MQDACAVGKGAGGPSLVSLLWYTTPMEHRAPGCSGTDQVTFSRYQWSLSMLCFLLIAYTTLISKRENRHIVKSNPSCDLTLPTEYCEK